MPGLPCVLRECPPVHTGLREGGRREQRVDVGGGELLPGLYYLAHEAVIFLAFCPGTIDLLGKVHKYFKAVIRNCEPRVYTHF